MIDSIPARTTPIGIVLLSLFFALGALLAFLSCAALLTPGGFLEPMWRLNPSARPAFARMGPWAVVLMAGVTAACAAAALGLWNRRRWGHRLACGLLMVNLVGDTANAVLRGDLRTLIGVPIGGILLAYLLSRRVRDYLSPPLLRGDGAPP